ncbi:alpha/beta hydrolase family esterase [Streptomyces sp. NPDC058247]|uniref:alpha/beta hydrolase family esterase n=1 Tax=Streptomyces sp. NPDC058247 TaxID=3346401 RepID=UPI0036E0FEAF
MRARRTTLLAALAVTSSLALAAPAHSATAPQHNGPAKHCSLPVGDSTVTVHSGGLARTALVYRPADTGAATALPLHLSLHGSSSRASEQLVVSGLEDSADRHHFLAVAPQGVMQSGTGYQWNVPGVTGDGGPDDEQFLTDLLDTLGATGCADTGQVFASGYSGGGRMVSQYACDHPGRVTAIGPVAGLRAGVPVDDDGATVPEPGTCTPKQSVPVITFHGTADLVNPYDGAGRPYWGYGTDTALAAWAHLDNCTQGPAATSVSEHVTKIAYGACRGGADVVLYRVAGGGHTWPGSDLDFGPLGPVTQEIDATELAWQFFEAHRHNRADLPTAPDAATR